MSPNLEILIDKAKKAGQSHIFNYINENDSVLLNLLNEEISDIDFEKINQSFESTKVKTSKVDSIIQPPDDDVIGTYKDLIQDPSIAEEYRNLSYSAIKDGKVAVLLMAGGQGTRLGVTYPKGMYDVNLPSKSSLYELQAGRLIGLCNIVKRKLGGNPVIYWYIMTSEHTKEQTEDFFKENNYFGYNPELIIYFEQFTLPALSFDGKILMETPTKVFKAPNGNGGLYEAARENGILKHMKDHGVEHVQLYCVDNIMIKMADPDFIGFCMSKKADCAAKVVEKIDPLEPIGVVGQISGHYRVIEYSEISAETASLRLSTVKDSGEGYSRLLYSRGNICIHYMTREFLEKVSDPSHEHQIPYHVAKKKIPVWDPVQGCSVAPTQPNGIKLEKFIFDVFPMAKYFQNLFFYG